MTAPLVAGACAGIAAFQVSLAAGAPLGALAWGGSHPGRLPQDLRVASGISAGTWAVLGAAIASGRPRDPRGRAVLMGAVTALSTAGVITNLASQSLPERMLWVPVTAAMAALAGRETRRLVRSARAAADG